MPRIGTQAESAIDDPNKSSAFEPQIACRQIGRVFIFFCQLLNKFAFFRCYITLTAQSSSNGANRKTGKFRKLFKCDHKESSLYKNFYKNSINIEKVNLK